MNTEIFDLGKIGITPGGNWDANTFYEKLTIVFYEGDGYCSIIDNTNKNPKNNNNIWMPIVRHGYTSYEQMIASGKFIGTEEEYLEFLRKALNSSAAAIDALNKANNATKTVEDKMEEANIALEESKSTLNNVNQALDSLNDNIERAETAARIAVENSNNVTENINSIKDSIQTANNNYNEIKEGLKTASSQEALNARVSVVEQNLNTINATKIPYEDTINIGKTNIQEALNYTIDSIIDIKNQSFKNIVINETLLKKGFYNNSGIYYSDASSRCCVFKKNPFDKYIIINNENAPTVTLKIYNKEGLKKQPQVSEGNSIKLKIDDDVTFMVLMWYQTIIDTFNYNVTVSSITKDEDDTINALNNSDVGLRLRQQASIGILDNCMTNLGYGIPTEDGYVNVNKTSQKPYIRKSTLYPINTPGRYTFSGALRIMNCYKVLNESNTLYKYKVNTVKYPDLVYNTENNTTSLIVSQDILPCIFSLADKDDTNNYIDTEFVSFSKDIMLTEKEYSNSVNSFIKNSTINSPYNTGTPKRIVLNNNNTLPGFVNNAGFISNNDKSRFYIVYGNNAITINNPSGIATDIKEFKRNIDGTNTLLFTSTISDISISRPKSDKDFTVIMFFKNLEHDINFEFDIEISDTNYELLKDIDFYKTINTIIGNPESNFAPGGYGLPNDNNIIVWNDITTETYKRWGCKIPMTAGTLVVKGHVTPINFYKVDGLGNGFYNYKTSGYQSGNTFTSYDEDLNETTIVMTNSYPAVFTLCDAIDRNNTIECEFVSFTPAGSTTSNQNNFDIPIIFSNPCEPSEEFKSFAEPTIVVTNNGTIVISALCGGPTDAYVNTLNSYSSDGGNTWHTNFTTGHRYIVYDRELDRLLSLDSVNLFVSNDYGMTWNNIGTVDWLYHTQVTDEYNRLRNEEKANYEADSTIQRYAYQRYQASSPNPGCQLSNGVICFQRRDGIKKYKASKDEDGNWILGTDGYPKVVDSSFGNTVDIEQSCAYITYSKDNGNTWESSDITPVGVMMDELAIAEVEPNQICINGRGGTEAGWVKRKVNRHIFFQQTPINSKNDFTIDAWIADYETKDSNTINDSIVNAAFHKVNNFKPSGSTMSPITFWLFCNIYNPGRFERHSQLLRVSSNGHDWSKVKLISQQYDIVGGYVSIASDNNNIYLVMEDKRTGKPLRFINLSKEILEDIIIKYNINKQLYNN